MYWWIYAIVLGLFAGLAVGYTLKMAFKLLLLVLGFFIVGVGLLWYYGFVAFDIGAASVIADKLRTMFSSGLSGETYRLSLELIPPIISFFIGFVYAIKKL